MAPTAHLPATNDKTPLLSGARFVKVGLPHGTCHPPSVQWVYSFPKHCTKKHFLEGVDTPQNTLASVLWAYIALDIQPVVIHHDTSN